MSFEDIPEDKEESYPCPSCDDGIVTKQESGLWECDICTFRSIDDD